MNPLNIGRQATTSMLLVQSPRNLIEEMFIVYKSCKDAAMTSGHFGAILLVEGPSKATFRELKGVHTVCALACKAY